MSDEGTPTGETYDLSPDIFTLSIPRTKLNEVRTEEEKIELWMWPEDAEDFAEFVASEMADSGAGTINVPLCHAEELLQAANSIWDDIASGRQYGYDPEEHDSNAAALAAARKDLRERIQLAREGGDRDE